MEHIHVFIYLFNFYLFYIMKVNRKQVYFYFLIALNNREFLYSPSILYANLNSFSHY